MTLHDYIKEAVNNKTSKKITDKDFFTSRHFCKYLSDILNGLAHRGGLKRRVTVKTVWDSAQDRTAWTDNFYVHINANSKMLEGLNREERFKGIRGIAFHEMFHLIFTNFDAWNEVLNDVKEGKHSFNEEIDTYFSENPHVLTCFFNKYKFLLNTIEDAYIELRGNTKFPGFGKDVIFVRDLQKKLGSSFKELKQIEKNCGLKVIDTLFNMIISYSLLGGLQLTSKDYKDQRVQAIVGIMDLIDAAIGEYNAYKRINLVDEMVISLWDYFKETLDEIDPTDTPKSDEGVPGKYSSEMPSVSATSDTAKADSETGAEGEKSKTVPNKETTSDGHSYSGSKGTGSSESEETKDNYGTKKRSTASEEDESEKPHTEDEILHKLSEGSTEPSETVREESIDEVDEKALEDELKALEKRLETSCSPSEDNLSDEEYERLINEYNDKFGDYDKSIHDGITCKISRRKDTSVLKRIYEAEGKQYFKLGKRMASELREALSEKQNGGRTSGMYWGTQIDSHKLFAPDGKIFYKDILPEESTFGTEVCVLVDESGSMFCENRIVYAKTCAMVLYSICRELEIPVAVYGHTANTAGYDVCIQTYADFERPMDTDKYRIMEMDAKCNNRDGYAVKYCCDRLMERRAAKKLFFIISDGAPAAYGYDRVNGGADLRRLLNSYTKKGITFIAAGIGSDASSLKSIYGEHFLPIDNLKTLPRTLGKLLRRQLHIVA